MMLAVLFLNIAGLDRVSDIEVLESDRGLCTLVRRFEPRLFGVSRGSLARRFRGGRERCFPSARSIRDWLDRFHVAGVHDAERRKGCAFIPPHSACHDLFREVNRRLVAEGVRAVGAAAVTIDLDATIIASGKRECLSTYRAAAGLVPGERGYQPLIAFCPEIGMVPWLEMRDGNVPAKLDNRRGFEEALMQLPGAVGRAVLRSDAAGYQEEVIRACNEPAFRREETRRLGTVGLVCGAVRSEALMAEVARLREDAWRPMPADRRRRRAASGRGQLECAELPYVPASTECDGAAAPRRLRAGVAMDADEAPPRPVDPPRSPRRASWPPDHARARHNRRPSDGRLPAYEPRHAAAKRPRLTPGNTRHRQRAGPAPACPGPRSGGDARPHGSR